MSTVLKEQNHRGSAAGSSPADAGSPPSAAHETLSHRRLAFVAPRFAHDPDWPWLTRIGTFALCRFQRRTIVNDYEPLPKLTKPFQQWQYFAAGRALRDADVAFLFSPEVAMGMTGPLARLHRRAKCIYVGLHQDGPLELSYIDRVGAALRRCAAVCILTEAERELYIPRYGLDPARAHVVPIHTDHADGYGIYSDPTPEPQPYVLAMGSPNRVFRPTVEQCVKRNIPIVVITRPWHASDDLDELAHLGAKVITDADMTRAMTYLKHARLSVFDFVRTEYASGFITLVHSMFLRTPIVSSDCLGIPEHVVDQQTGFVVPHGDAAALGEAIDAVWSDDARAARFAEAGFERAKQRHSLESAAESYAALAERVQRD